MGNRSLSLCAVAICLFTLATAHGQVLDSRAIDVLATPGSAFALSSDGERLATYEPTSSGGTVRLFDMAALSGVPLWQTPADSLANPSLAFSPDRRIVALSSGNICARPRVDWFDVATGALLQSLPASLPKVRGVAFSPDNRYFAWGEGSDTAPSSGRVVVYNLSDRTQRTLEGHTGVVDGLAFSPDGTQLASASWDRTVRVWDLASATSRTLVGHTDKVHGVQFSPDGTTLASSGCSGDGSIRLWNPDTGSQLSVIWVGETCVGSVAFSPDSRYLVSAGIKTGVQIWNAETGLPIAVIRSSAESPYMAQFAPRSEKVVSTARNQVLVQDVHSIIRFGDLPTAAARFSWSRIDSGESARVAIEPRLRVEMRFEASGSTASTPGGRIISYVWNFFGVYHYSGGPDSWVYITFYEAGSYSVTLTVLDDRGASASVTQTVKVPPGSPPQAKFTYQPSEPVASSAVRFVDESMDADGRAVAWSWDFGDGAMSTEQNPSHAYSGAGTYTVELAVTDDDGLIGARTEIVTVAQGSIVPPRLEKQWALVVGIGDYEDPAIRDLQYTDADAQAFYDFLIDPNGGGFARERVRFLLDEQATLEALTDAFFWLITASGKEDLVVVYFAGHGGTGDDLSWPRDEPDGIDEYLVSWNAQPTKLFSTALRDDVLGDLLGMLSSRCDNVVVILDCCFSAGATRSLATESVRASGNQVFGDLVSSSGGPLILAASEEAEVSHEDPTLGHGVFTYYLLRGLGALGGAATPEADDDGNGKITIEELQKYLVSRIGTAWDQHPIVRGDAALARVALNGYNRPLVGEITLVETDLVFISLGTRDGVQPGDHFLVEHELTVPGIPPAFEPRGTIEVLYTVDATRSACRIVQQLWPFEIKDRVTLKE